jgi:hypothetical protein
VRPDQAFRDSHRDSTPTLRFLASTAALVSPRRTGKQFVIAPTLLLSGVDSQAMVS